LVPRTTTEDTSAYMLEAPKMLDPAAT
jgi:hypothetical protein